MPKATLRIRTVRPIGYSIPMDGPVGTLVQAQGRHGMRPAHIHFLVSAPGYRELVTALYVKGDAHIADDVVFGSSADLVAELKQDDPACPLKAFPSMRFDLTLSREGAATRKPGAWVRIPRPSSRKRPNDAAPATEAASAKPRSQACSARCLADS